MQTAPAGPRATLSLVSASTPQAGFDAVREGLQPYRADIVRSAPHAWAILADIARMAGQHQRAEELIALAYLAYDVVGPAEPDAPADPEAKWGPSVAVRTSASCQSTV